MPDVEELKSRARRAEAAGDYRLALEAYRDALERERETTHPDMMDPALRLRVGDLHFRLGEPDRALDAYLRASELYAEQGLIPNAIAVCNKVLGVYPDHVDTHRQLAELQLKIGLTADARNNLLRYMEEAMGRGRGAAAREAAQAFLDEEPDQQVAVQVAEMLAAEGREERALSVLRRVWEVRTGLRQPAGRIEACARQLDPDADLSEWTPVWPPPRRGPGEPAGDGEAGEQEAGPATPDVQPAETADAGDVPAGAPGAPGSAVEPTGATPAAAAAGPPGPSVGPSDEAEGTPRPAPPVAEPVPETGPGPGADEAPRTAAALEEPPAETGDRERREEPGRDGTGGRPPPPPRHDGAGTPDAADTGPADGNGGEPGRRGVPPAAAGERPRRAPSPGGTGAGPGTGEGPPPPGERKRPAPETDREAELRRGLELVEEMLEVAPGHLDLHRRRVLYARRLGDLRLLERALVDLGRALMERGSHRGARFVFEEVRERLNPGSAPASEALQRLNRQEERPADREVEEEAGAPPPRAVRREAGVDRRFRRRLREALSASSRELAWLHAAAESCDADGTGPAPAASHELMGRYLLMRGRPADAAEHLRAALDRSSPGGERAAELLYHLGRAWRRAGEADRARDCFERLAETDPDFGAAWDVVMPEA